MSKMVNPQGGQHLEPNDLNDSSDSWVDINDNWGDVGEELIASADELLQSEMMDGIIFKDTFQQVINWVSKTEQIDQPFLSPPDSPAETLVCQSGPSPIPEQSGTNTKVYQSSTNRFQQSHTSTMSFRESSTNTKVYQSSTNTFQQPGTSTISLQHPSTSAMCNQPGTNLSQQPYTCFYPSQQLGIANILTNQFATVPSQLLNATSITKQDPHTKYPILISELNETPAVQIGSKIICQQLGHGAKVLPKIDTSIKTPAQASNSHTKEIVAKLGRHAGIKKQKTISMKSAVKKRKGGRSKKNLSKRAHFILNKWYALHKQYSNLFSAYSKLACACRITVEQVEKWIYNKRFRNGNTTSVNNLNHSKVKPVLIGIKLLLDIMPKEIYKKHLAALSADLDCVPGDDCCVKHQRRGDRSLPCKAVYHMKMWLLDHIERPYPTDQEGATLAKMGGITIKQLRTYFSNMRNRIPLYREAKKLAHKQSEEMVEAQIKTFVAEWLARKGIEAD